MKSQRLAIEQHVLRSLRDRTLPRRWLLAVSGGVDSMVMAEIVRKWQRLLKLELGVVYVHHGRGSREQEAYRDSARALVKEWCRKVDLPFFTNAGAPDEVLVSEDQLRKFRLSVLESLRDGHNFDALAFAHHADDLLETRLHRLIRGVGPSGLMSMQRLRGHRIRPILSLCKREIETYAALSHLRWVEDPTNAGTDAFRNWLRQEWLPLLEQRQPGATKSLARSLAMLAQPVQDLEWGAFVGLRRSALAGLQRVDQEEFVARYFRSLGVRGYSQAHVAELLKRLQSTQAKRSFSFTMLDWTFHVDADQLWASRV